MNKIAIIRKVDGKYILYSKKKNPKTGKRRRLGESDTLKGIQKREKQIQFFKRFHADDQYANDKTFNISQIAQYLEEAGFIDSAQVLYNTMAAFDGMEDSAKTSSGTSANYQQILEDFYEFFGGMWMFGDRGNQKIDRFVDKLLNKINLYLSVLENKSENTDKEQLKNLYALKETIFDYMKIRKNKDMALDQTSDIPEKSPPSFGLFEARVGFLRSLVKTAKEFDESGLIQEADELDAILQELIQSYEQNNVDMFVNINGLQGQGVIENQNAGMFSGLSDSYFYSGYENQEGAYEHRKDPQYTRPELERKLTI